MLNFNLLVDQLCEQGFYLVDHFLPEKNAHLLRELAFKLNSQRQLRAAKIGDQTNNKSNHLIRTDQIYWLNSNSPNIEPFWQAISQIKLLLNTQLYLGIQEFETHFALYEAGTFYKKHVDQFKHKKNRKISFVYYLNTYWQESFAGQLILYNQQNELVKTILPTWNRFICFLSHLPHEVKTTKRNRLSITGWMKTNDTQITC